MDNDLFEKTYNEFLNGTKSAISTWIYYIFAGAVVVVMIFLQLGGIQLNKDIEWHDIILDAVPLFFASILLDRIFYYNGVSKGKKTKNYFGAVQEFSTLANLTGEEIDVLPDFCREFNAKALRNKRKTLLSYAVVSIEHFESEHETKNGTHLPLQVTPNRIIRKEFGWERSRWIRKAKRAKIKGLTACKLTSEQATMDDTNTGFGERGYATIQTIKKVVGYALSFLLFALITVKDVATWGWVGVGILLFKITFTLGSSILSQAKGYQDITVSVVAHYNRKSDILKQFKSWCSKTTFSPSLDHETENHNI